MKRTTAVLIMLALLILTACGAPATDVPDASAPAIAATDPPAPTDAPPPTEEPTATPEPTAVPVGTGGGTGNIAFISDRAAPNAAFDLFLFNIDTPDEEPLQLTEGVRVNTPAFAPDGSLIAFSWNDGASWNIYTVPPDGSLAFTQVTDFSSAVADWSPDGTRLVFNSDHQNEAPNVPDLYAMNLDGSDLVELVDSPETLDFNARWSPDGARIVFASDRSGAVNLHAMNADGSDVVQITDTEATDQQADWSPDGSRIVFVSDRAGNPDIYVMNADGSEVVQLTETDTYEGGPVWSPDGEYIAFHAAVDGVTKIFLMKPDGSAVTQVTPDDYNCAFPTWQPLPGE